MRSIFTVTIFIILLTLSNRATNAQSFDWAKNVISSRFSDGVQGMTIDSVGNIYVTGWFNDTADVDPGPGVVNLISNGTYDIFIAKYDVNGNLIWARGIGGTYIGDRGRDIELDDAGNIYVTGYFGDTVDFDPGSRVVNLISSGGNDIFIAKYDNDGNFVWAKNMGSTNQDGSNAMVVDAGYIYITGMFSGVADFDPGPGVSNLTSQGNNSRDIFIAKYDTSGKYLWAIGIGGTSIDNANDIAVDTAGNIYVTGEFRNTVDFNPGIDSANLIGGSKGKIFIAKYDANGNYIWAFGMGGASGIGSNAGLAIALDDSAHVYITGSFVDTTADFDPDPATSAILKATGMSTNIFMAKYDTDGHYLWANSVGGSSAWGTMGEGCAITNVNGNIYITGEFAGDSLDFDPGPGNAVLRTTGLSDMFIAKYDTEGNYIWVKQIGSNSSEQGNAIAVNGNGDVYVGCEFHGIVDFDPGPGVSNLASNNGSSDGCILKLSCGSPTAQRITTTACDSSYLLNGTVYTASGTYSQMYFAADGCDSMIVLNLTLSLIDKPAIRIDEFELSITGSYATYQWIKNGIPIPGATGSTYNIDENADYQVAVTNEHGCADTSDIYPVTNWTSVDELNNIKQWISVYPNPSTDIVHIRSSFPVNAKLTDIAGRVIKEINDARTIFVKDFNAGIYLLQISNEAGQLINTVKVVKK